MKMETIICDAKKIKVEQVEEIGGVPSAPTPLAEMKIFSRAARGGISSRKAVT
jgi:hypothetical protein